MAVARQEPRPPNFFTAFQLRVAQGTKVEGGAPRTLNERAAERTFHPL